MHLNDEEVDAIVAYFKSDVRNVHIGATYITQRDPQAPKVVQNILTRCIQAKAAR